MNKSKENFATITLHTPDAARTAECLKHVLKFIKKHQLQHDVTITMKAPLPIFELSWPLDKQKPRARKITWSSKGAI